MKIKRIVTCALLFVLLLGNFMAICSASWVEDFRCWYWTDNTEIRSVAVGDIDGDGSKDIVTGGHYYDGTRLVSQLVVWDGTSGAVKKVKCWHWGSDTCIFSIAVGNIDSDSDIEIVTGGYYISNGIAHALLAVWCSGSGEDLTLEDCDDWWYGSSTFISSVAIGNFDGDAFTEIIAAGTCWGGSHFNGFMRDYEYRYGNLSYTDEVVWYFPDYNTCACSIAVGDADGDGYDEIIAGGYFYDEYDAWAWLMVFSGTLDWECYTTWDLESCNTYVSSVAIGNVDDDNALELVTGGYYIQNDIMKSQIKVWSVSNNALVVEDTSYWYTSSHTYVASVAIGDCDFDGYVEIVSGGAFDDGSRKNSQFKIFTGSNLDEEETKSWYWTYNTEIFSVAVDNLARDLWKDIVTGGYYYDGTRKQAQLVVWTTRPAAALIWGTSYYPEGEMGGQTERTASEDASEYIYNLFDSKEKFGYVRNSWGPLGTQPYNVYGNVSYCEDNHSYTAIFYKGHICVHDWQCGVEGCDFSHYSLYDNEGSEAIYDQLIDWKIHEDDDHVSRLSSKTHDFVFLWACGWGYEDYIGEFDENGHSRGMLASWMGVIPDYEKHIMESDGYDSPDGCGRCFISFENASINFGRATQKIGKLYVDWVERFYYHALQNGYTVNQALDLASWDASGKSSFSECELYTGYLATLNGQDWWSRMRVWGDGYYMIGGV